MTVAAGFLPYMPRINLDRYDRAPNLSPVERQVLGEWNSRRGYRPLKICLVRLYQPLADVFSPVQRNRNGIKRTFTFVLEEVRRTRMPYWAWPEQHWLDLLNGPDASAGSSRVARPYLLAVAYLLNGFSRAHVIPAKPRAAVGIRLAARGSGRVPLGAERQCALGP
jgi:hypothetical protein